MEEDDDAFTPLPLPSSTSPLWQNIRFALSRHADMPSFTFFKLKLITITCNIHITNFIILSQPLWCVFKHGHWGHTFVQTLLQIICRHFHQVYPHPKRTWVCPHSVCRPRCREGPKYQMPGIVATQYLFQSFTQTSINFRITTIFVIALSGISWRKIHNSGRNICHSDPERNTGYVKTFWCVRLKFFR